MKNLMMMAMAVAMILSLSTSAVAFDNGHGGLEGNYLDIEQRGAFNSANVEQDIESYGNKMFNKAEITQCGLMNSVYVDQKATKHSNVYKIKQVGFGNTYCAYQR